MMITTEKCHYILVGNKASDDKIVLNGVELETSNEEKVLGGIIDNNLSFDVHIKSKCR